MYSSTLSPNTPVSEKHGWPGHFELVLGVSVRAPAFVHAEHTPVTFPSAVIVYMAVYALVYDTVYSPAGMVVVAPV